MRKYLIASLIATTLLISACGKVDDSTNSNSGNTGSGAETKEKLVVSEGDKVSVDYTGKLQDGTIFDSSIESESKKSTNYSSGRTFEPLSFTVGAGQMIKGFDRGVIGMKVGEKKTITIAPEDAYGTGGTDQTIPRKALESTFTEVVGRDRYQDTFPITVPKKTFDDQNRSVAVGQIITAGGINATVTKMDDTNVYLNVDNRQNPFYGKKLVVGLTGEFEGNKIAITKLDAKNVTIKVENRQNPFYGKTLAVGLSAEFRKEVFTIKKIDAENVVVERKHELAGKTLIFDVELKEIK